ncbi:helix-turn-helix DNA binding protein [Gordonia phage Holliday]|nr:helix-turn-helix DNA binding protein [Gordonia phage Holliday]
MTDEEKAMLDLAGQRWNYPGSLEQRVRDEFGISLTRFYQRVNQLIDTEEALAYSPVVVNRLRRLRTRRP